MESSELLKRINAKNPPTIIDVRTGFEFRAGHIPGAIHAPTWKILLCLAQIPSDKNAELVVTCQHGPRAEFAKSLLRILGYQNVNLLSGHMADWRKSGQHMEK